MSDMVVPFAYHQAFLAKRVLCNFFGIVRQAGKNRKYERLIVALTDGTIQIWQ
jgi:hypothetical protein